jgi:NAD(P)-dependent dehydrogenase (short-subunit alcohol dehydrogenase family)
MEWRNSTALVTGASSGIGAEFAGAGPGRQLVAAPAHPAPRRMKERAAGRSWRQPGTGGAPG